MIKYELSGPDCSKAEPLHVITIMSRFLKIVQMMETSNNSSHSSIHQSESKIQFS